MVRWFFLCCCLCLGAQVVQESFQRDPGPLDFIRGEGFEQFVLQALSGDALVGLDTHGRVVPRLARKWDIKGRTLRFELREDARFADGSPVTSADVMWTFQTIRSSQDASPTKRAILEKVEVCAKGLEVELSSPKPTGRLLLELATLPVAKKDHPGTGSGPFLFQRTGADWQLTARKHFLHPQVSGLHFRLIADEQAVLQNLQKGWLSIGVPPARRGLKAPPTHIELRQPTHAQVIVWSRAGVEPLRLLEAWRNSALQPGAVGNKASASRGLWPESLGFPARSIQNVARSEPRIRNWELLYGAGDHEIQRLLQILREEARKEGVELELRPVETNILYDRLLRGDFQLACALNLFDPHPWSVLDLLEPKGALNFSHWNHPRLETILAKLQSPGDPAWDELQVLWAQAPTSLPLADFTSVVWVDRRLKVQPSSLGLYLTTPGAAGWSWER